jgi:aspartate-semialdehyde dehydrogenase
VSAVSKDQVVVAVVGATGAVGEILLRVLEERQFPVSQLKPLASTRSAGTTITFRGEAIAVEVACADAFEGVDVVFFAATGGLSKELAPEAVKRGAVVIDKSSTWRMDEDVPLVVPEINADALEKHRGIIANPNCTTTGLVMAVEPIRRAAGLKSLVVTTLQAVSGSGTPGIEELEGQLAAKQAGKAAPAPKVFPMPIACNVLPLCDTFQADGYSTEERKLLDETRKILELPDLDVSMSCVRVPVPVGHSATVLIETERPLSPDAAREALAAFPGVRVVDDPSTNLFPTPADVEGSDDVLVGRVLKDYGSDRLWLWEVSDNLRKGAATNAVQIAEALLERGLLQP